MNGSSRSTAAMHRRSHAFTLIEVLACVMILSVGLLSATSLVLYGLRLHSLSHGREIGVITAESVLGDANPLATDPALSPNGATTSGFLNGLWVERTESGEMDISGGMGTLSSVYVTVDVFESQSGRPIVSLARRVIRDKR